MGSRVTDLRGGFFNSPRMSMQFHNSEGNLILITGPASP